MSNLQELYDKVAIHLLTQGKRSIVIEEFDEVRCCYRSVNNLKCAIGILIPDDLYSPAIENRSVENLPENILVAIAGETPEIALPLLTALQHVHDRYDSSRWVHNLNSVARAYNLDPKVVTEWPKN